MNNPKTAAIKVGRGREGNQRVGSDNLKTAAIKYSICIGRGGGHLPKMVSCGLITINLVLQLCTLHTAMADSGSVTATLTLHISKLLERRI